MDPKSDGCRLCLDSFAECFTTIDNPQLKVQMEKVFCFSIELKQGYSSGVCQSCSYAISEFYQYSEKVRQNQQFLSGNVTNCDPTVDSKTKLESIKNENRSYSVLLETTGTPWEPKHEVSGEERVPTVDSKITVETLKDETCSDSGLPETMDDTWESKEEDLVEGNVSSFGDSESFEPPAKKLRTKRKELDEPTSSSKQTVMKTPEERNEENQRICNHYRMICDLCGTPAATYPALVGHFRKEHNRHDGYVVCCNKKLSRRQAILDHIDFHANPEAFRCQLCGKKYITKDTLDKHVLYMHSSEDQRSFKCDFCPQTFALKSTLALHRERHLNFKCPVCNNLFAYKRSLTRHMIDLHSGVQRKLTCETCGKQFQHQRNLDRHTSEQHMGVEEQRIRCGLCNQWLVGKVNFRNHVISAHRDGDPAFECDVCQQKYPNIRTLRQHKSLSHGQPKHECEFCGQNFKLVIALREHRAIHVGEVVDSK